MKDQSRMPNKRLPDFLLVGAAKSATSSLYLYLEQHPQIRMPSLKESWFFSFYKNPPNYSSPGKLSNVVSELDEYLRLFDGAGDDQILGDACPSYLYTYKDTIANIKRIYPETERNRLKIIISLREPVSRALSQYYTFKRKVEEPLDFEQAMLESTINDRMQSNWNIFYDYNGFGMYSNQVEAFQKAFGKDRVLVILYDDIQEDIQSVFRKIYQFLGVDPNFVNNDAVKHNSLSGEPGFKWLVAAMFSKNKIKRTAAALIPKKLRMLIIYVVLKPLLRKNTLNDQTLKKMSPHFQNDILKLEKLIDRDLSNWRVNA